MAISREISMKILSNSFSYGSSFSMSHLSSIVAYCSTLFFMSRPLSWACKELPAAPSITNAAIMNAVFFIAFSNYSLLLKNVYFFMIFFTSLLPAVSIRALA